MAAKKMKDHEKRDLVNRLTRIAREFAETEQLRARLSGEVFDALDAAVAAERERWKAALALPHYYGGDCPDPDQPKARDLVNCAACRALVELGA